MVEQLKQAQGDIKDEAAFKRQQSTEENERVAAALERVRKNAPKISPKRRSRSGSFCVPMHPVKAARAWREVFEDEFVDNRFGRAFISIGMIFMVKEITQARRQGKKIQDTRTVGCLLENSGVLALASLRSALPEQERVSYSESRYEIARKIVKNSILTILGGMIVEYGSVVLLHLIQKTIYPHVKWFRPVIRNPSPFTLRSLSEWVKGNAIAQIGGNTFQVFVESWLKDDEYKGLVETPNAHLHTFLRNFIVLRFVNDVMFYLGHRLLHVHPWIYRNIHKRHHSHMTTSLPTNFMFTPLDVLVEAAIPIGVGLTVLGKLMGVPMGRFESNVLVSYHSWYDAGTHLGKNIPCISMFAPFALFYNQFWDFDRKAIMFHEIHHNKIMCNYGITSWLDCLVGTAQMPL
jgi:sterol desaturase/sphingolipid hydroxylase (fatty acid hydroxylase superfamily)